MPSVIRALRSPLLACSLVLSSFSTQAADLLDLAKDLQPNTNGLPASFSKPMKVSMCFFDLQGKNGEFYSRAKDLALIARRWNIIADFKVFSEEKAAAESFKAGQCDAAVMSSLRARQFNQFMGSVDAPGALPSYEHVRILLKSLFDPKLEALTITPPYQIVSVFPVGAQYIHVRDRKTQSLSDFKDQKIAVLDWDSSLSTLAKKLGGEPTPLALGGFSKQFNKGKVDTIIAPAMLYWPYELYRGLGETGGIYKTPVNQLTASLIINRDALQKKSPDLDARIAAFHAISSQFLDQMLGPIFGTITKLENDIPANYWITPDAAQQEQFNEQLRQARLSMTKEGLYDARMMKVLKRVRCKLDANAKECSLPDEQ